MSKSLFKTILPPDQGPARRDYAFPRKVASFPYGKKHGVGSSGVVLAAVSFLWVGLSEHLACKSPSFVHFFINIVVVTIHLFLIS